MTILILIRFSPLHINVGTMNAVEFVVPLLPIDRFALDRVKTACPELAQPAASSISAAECNVFQFWIWTHSITEYLHGFLNQGRVVYDYDGDLSIAYASALDHLGCLHDSDMALSTSLFRVHTFKDANPLFLSDLGDRSSGDIKCVPALADYDY